MAVFGDRPLKVLALAVALLLIGVDARADTVSPWGALSGLDQPSYLSPSPLDSKNPLTHRSREYSGIAVSDWLLYPEFLLGAVYNDNLLQTQTHRTAGLGARLQADVTGVRDAGLSRTTVFGRADAYLYPDHGRENTYDGQIGVAQIWALQSDLTVKAQIEFDQASYLTFGGLVATPAGGAATLIAPQNYQQVQSSAAVQKSFGRYFVGVSLSEAATAYDSLSTSAGSFSQSYRNDSVTTLTERAGYWLTPLIYGYGEAAENWRQYVNDPFTSHGYRTVAGLGSDRISLFRGEIFAGYQEQFYQSAQLGAARSPVLGGKLYWYPTRAWTLSASLDETFGAANNPTPSNPLGDPARIMAAKLTAQYQLGRLWSAQGLAEYDVSRYLGIGRVDDTFVTGVSVNREIARNFNVNVDYKLLLNRSNAAGSSFINNILGGSAVYKF